MFLLIYVNNHIYIFDHRECWGTQVACSECVVERFCSNECLHTALRSYHSFDCGGGTVEKGVASHSFASFDKMLTDVSVEQFMFLQIKPMG